MKQQILLSVGGVVLLIGLFFFGKIESQKSNVPPHKENTAPAFSISDYIKKEKQKLSSSRAVEVLEMENSVKRGDVKDQTIKVYNQLAGFWKDSVKSFVPYANYLAESAKLDNSEKNLTFAARLILGNLRAEEDGAIRSWEAATAVDLFERALKLDPDNDDLKVDLGSCYVYGNGMIGDAAGTMKGIQQLLQVAQKDSGNMKAQLVLGIGGVISRQYDKAIDRLTKVVSFDPQNLEAVSWLGDAYAAKGDKTNAVKWYEYSEKLVNNPEYTKEVDERIKALK